MLHLILGPINTATASTRGQAAQATIRKLSAGAFCDALIIHYCVRDAFPLYAECAKASRSSALVLGGVERRQRIRTSFDFAATKPPTIQLQMPDINDGHWIDQH